MTEVPDWDNKIHPTIKALIQFVDDRLPTLTSTEFPHPRVMAAAYLARVRRLVMATEALYEAGMSDVVGVPLRVCFEAWVTGMWVVLVGQDAADRLNADYAIRINHFVERARLDVEPVPGTEGADQLPNVWQRTDAVGKALVVAGDEAGSELLWAYALVYTGESTTSIHAGFPTAVGYINFDDEDRWAGVQSDRQDNSDGSGKLLCAAILLTMLARRVFAEFNIGLDELDELATPIHQIGRASCRERV